MILVLLINGFLNDVSNKEIITSYYKFYIRALFLLYVLSSHVYSCQIFLQISCCKFDTEMAFLQCGFFHDESDAIFMGNILSIPSIKISLCANLYARTTDLVIQKTYCTFNTETSFSLIWYFLQPLISNSLETL